MSPKKPGSPMRVKLDGERRDLILRATRKFFGEKMDVEFSNFQAEEVVDFFVKELGAPVYNQAIRDAHGFFQEKLADLEGDFYEPE